MTIETPIHALPMDIGPGIILRRYRGGLDHAHMARVANARLVAAGMIPSSTPEDIANTYRNLVNCNPVTDIAIVELRGAVAGYGRVFWEDETDGPRAFYLVTNLAPETDGRGVARAIVAWQEGRVADSRSQMAAHRSGMVEVGFVHGDEPDSRAALVEAGFTLARRHAEMRRVDFEGIPDLPLPDGLEIRAIGPDDRVMHRRIYRADMAAFQDHWGATAPTEEGFQEFIGQPTFDPSLWRVAFNGDEIAGQILNYLGPPDAEGRRVGWTEAISTQRPWRRRGVARALLAESLRTVRDAGATSAALGVDQQNPNQALHLYESLGFRLTAEEFEFRKILDAGDGADRGG